MSLPPRLIVIFSAYVVDVGMSITAKVAPRDKLVLLTDLFLNDIERSSDVFVRKALGRVKQSNVRICIRCEE